ncbi:hypothetical protein HPB50_001485 [Hyalomma asiaticum]|uniref:Uncharacterized protein n=1 Tax=Hyalomma asiaticum TaxID=266040 RepID=A0ACB7TD46_HYAAI|nr:hypothetical protein HPB50_001485 [Hyalomma asiaticum]
MPPRIVCIKQIKVKEKVYSINAYYSVGDGYYKCVIHNLDREIMEKALNTMIVHSGNPRAMQTKQIKGSGSMVIVFEGYEVLNHVGFGGVLLKCYLYRRQMDLESHMPTSTVQFLSRLVLLKLPISRSFSWESTCAAICSPTGTYRARLYTYSLKHSYLPPEVARLFGALMPSEGHVKRVCRILRSEACQQVHFYTDCLQMVKCNELPAPIAQKGYLEDLRLASQTADFLWGNLHQYSGLGKDVKVLGDASIPKNVADLLRLGPKYCEHPDLDEMELFSLGRTAAGKASSRRSSTGGFVVMPRGLYKEKADAAINGNFNEVKGVVLTKVKSMAVQLCKKAGLSKLASSVRACKETSLSAFFNSDSQGTLPIPDHHFGAQNLAKRSGVAGWTADPTRHRQGVSPYGFMPLIFRSEITVRRGPPVSSRSPRVGAPQRSPLRDMELYRLVAPLSQRPLAARIETGPVGAFWVALWNLAGLTCDKASNLGVLEVVCRTALENGSVCNFLKLWYL